jgi:hypothetical protein
MDGRSGWGKGREIDRSRELAMASAMDTGGRKGGMEPMHLLEARMEELERKIILLADSVSKLSEAMKTIAETQFKLVASLTRRPDPSGETQPN